MFKALKKCNVCDETIESSVDFIWPLGHFCKSQPAVIPITAEEDALYLTNRFPARKPSLTSLPVSVTKPRNRVVR